MGIYNQMLDKFVELFDLPAESVYMWRSELEYTTMGMQICMGCGRSMPLGSKHGCWPDGSYYTVRELPLGGVIIDGNQDWITSGNTA